MLIVILLGAGVALSFGFAVVLAAFAVDILFCHRQSRLLGSARQGRAPTPAPVPLLQPLSRHTVSAEAV